jgi:hypothetical protein
MERLERWYVIIFTYNPRSYRFPWQRWNCKPAEPFLNPAFIEVLKASFFLRPMSVGSRIINQCTSSLEGHDERELPIAIVALAATGVWFSAFGWFFTA